MSAAASDEARLVDPVIIIVEPSRLIAASLTQAMKRWFLDCRTLTTLDGLKQALDDTEDAMVFVAADQLKGVKRLPHRADPAKRWVVMVSAKDGEGAGIDPSQFDAVLTKPIAKAELTDVMARLTTAAAPEEGPEPQRPRPAPRAEVALGLSVLVAEDNVVNQGVVERLLSGGGHKVQVVANGAEAVRAVATGTFDLVLMDIQMPVMDGITATREIRSLGDPARSALPIVALTGNDPGKFDAQCREAGMNAFISKPINRDELFSAIARWAKRSAFEL